MKKKLSDEIIIIIIIIILVVVVVAVVAVIMIDFTRLPMETNKERRFCVVFCNYLSKQK